MFASGTPRNATITARPNASAIELKKNMGISAKSLSRNRSLSLGSRGDIHHHRSPTAAAQLASISLLFVIVFAGMRVEYSFRPKSGIATRRQTSSSTSSTRAVDEAVLDAIQRECLRVYPKHLLAEMTKNNRKYNITESASIPDAVDEDPKRQMTFLSNEYTTAKVRRTTL